MFHDVPLSGQCIEMESHAVSEYDRMPFGLILGSYRCFIYTGSVTMAVPQANPTYALEGSEVQAPEGQYP